MARVVINQDNPHTIGDANDGMIAVYEVGTEQCVLGHADCKIHDMWTFHIVKGCSNNSKGHIRSGKISVIGRHTHSFYRTTGNVTFNHPHLYMCASGHANCQLWHLSKTFGVDDFEQANTGPAPAAGKVNVNAEHYHSYTGNEPTSGVIDMDTITCPSGHADCKFVPTYNDRCASGLESRVTNTVHLA